MTREEAINEIKSWDFLEGKEIEAIHTLIPELKESEDERTRKAALEGIEYLERKLGWDFIGDTDILDVKEYLEKQKEQKHCWKPTETDVALFNKAVTTNKALTPTERAQLDIIRSKFGCCRASNRSGIVQKWQKPAEWNEEDFEKLVGELVQDVVANERDAANYGDEKKPTSFFVKKYLERFKSLRPYWKPSEEQMNAIDYVLRYDKTGGFRDALKSLYGQLYNMYEIV